MNAATVTDDPEQLGGIRTFLESLARQITRRDLRTGHWYSKLQRAYLAYYAERVGQTELGAVPADRRAAVAHALIQRAAVWSSASGTGAAVGVTAASVAMARTAFLAAPVALPLAAAGLAAELFVRTVLHLQLTCELAELYGMPFNVDSETELLRVFALAVRAEMHETEDDPGRGLVERITRSQQSSTLGKLIASSLIGESLLRNAIPFADIVFSTARNWQLTHQVGLFVQGYASRRVALAKAVAQVAEYSPQALETLVEGVWFIFISDGRLTGIETALLSYLMRTRKVSAELTQHFVSDEAGWLEQLRALPEDRELRTRFLHALEVAAALEAPIVASELTILKRAADTLGVALTVVQAVQELRQVAASSKLEGEHEEGGPSVRERANAWTWDTAHWVTSTLYKLRNRPHIVTVTVSSQAE